MCPWGRLTWAPSWSLGSCVLYDLASRQLSLLTTCPISTCLLIPYPPFGFSHVQDSCVPKQASSQFLALHVAFSLQKMPFPYLSTGNP